MNDDASILSLWRQRGGLAYQGEGVTQLEHGWQCARLARQAGAAPALELATWLHDVGHLLSGLDGSPTMHGIDDEHEAVGARVLDSLFGSSVSQAVALHVQAKRYLVATRPAYRSSLSPDSVRSLALQGGAMSPAECLAFSRLPAAQDAQRLRVWDDLAKDSGLRPESPEQAVEQLATLMRVVRAQGPDRHRQQTQAP